MGRLPDSLEEVAAKGDRLQTLIVLRAHLARAIDRCTDAQELSSLALRFQRVLAEIHELGGAPENEETDEVAARRDAKLRAAAGS